MPERTPVSSFTRKFDTSEVLATGNPGRPAIGFSSYSVGWWMERPDPIERRLDELLNLAARLGFERLQVACNAPLETLSVEARAAFRQQAELVGVKLEVGSRRLTGEHLDRWIDLACEFSSPFVRFVIDGVGYHPALEEIEALLKLRLPRLREAGVILAIENHDRFRAGELAAMLDRLNSPFLGICLDTANSLGAGEGLETVARHLARHTVNLHLKDVRIRRFPHLQGLTVEGSVLGEGDLDFDPLLAQLREEGRLQSLTLEHWMSPLSSPRMTWEQELDWCERSSKWLHQAHQRWFP
jgi:sugar phosphate isomerase/epimerase